MRSMVAQARVGRRHVWLLVNASVAVRVGRSRSRRCGRLDREARRACARISSRLGQRFASGLTLAVADAQSDHGGLGSGRVGGCEGRHVRWASARQSVLDRGSDSGRQSRHRLAMNTLSLGWRSLRLHPLGQRCGADGRSTHAEAQGGREASARTARSLPERFPLKRRVDVHRDADDPL